VSFPLTERSSLFFNAGRYTQNPLYNNLYQNTGVGTIAGPGQGICGATQTKPSSRECYPTLASDAYTPPFIGNPNLLLEQSTAYEVGYASEFLRNYAINVTVFSKDETGLTGIRRSRAKQDIGTTYNGKSLPNYFAIVNQDYSTTRGIEIQFRRRISGYWGYDINYSFSKSTTNAQPPDRQQQSLQEGDSTALREIRSEIDQPHVFNAALFFRVDDRPPGFRLGRLLTNSSLTITERAASGLPYTPIYGFTGFGDVNQGDLFSGRGPATSETDLLATKDFRFANVRYGAVLRVVNLFDQKNCIQVFATTGRCDAGTIDQRRARQGNPVGEDVASTYFDRPEFFGPRRTIYTGLRVTF
jgi:outer membrane receptor protein involved in Fe transport